MTASETIRMRRSIRKFKPGVTIGQEQIEKLLEAAMMAPSACNTRPWEFVVVKSRDKLDEIAAVHPHGKMMSGASLAIIVCALPEVQHGVSEGFFPQDCAAATQNILLQATEMGLGSCWCGVYPKEDNIKKICGALGISGLPFNVIAIGAADTSPQARGFFEKDKVKYL